MNTKTLVLVDGTAYLYRAFHALPALNTTQGVPTGALYGMTSMLKRLCAEYQPTYAAVVFDAPGPTFRQTLYSDYKANRATMPTELSAQIPYMYQLVEALGFPLVMETGVEADDVIGTLAKQAEAAGLASLIFTSDKDFAQLVNAQITLIDTMKNTHLDSQGVQQKFGLPSALIVDYLCLMGDSVDNVPGVEKVGPKTAQKWLVQYGSLENLIAHADEIKGKVGDNLRRAIPYLQSTARTLLTIRCDVPLSVTPQQLLLNPPDTTALQTLFKTLEFKQWLAALPTVPVSTERNYSLILNQTDFSTWLARLQAADLFALDTETTSLDYRQAQIVGLSFAVQAHEAVYVPLAHDYLGAPTQLTRETVLAQLKPLLEDPNKRKVGQHLKYDAHVLANHGIQLQGIAYDTLLASYVLNSTTKHDMDSLALHYLGVQTITFEAIAGKGKHQLTFNQIHLEKAGPYAAEDADITWQLHEVLWPQLQAIPALEKVFLDLEMPLISILMHMERHGVKIDVAKLQAHSQTLATRLQQLETQAHQLAGEAFNLNSPKQLQAILFDKLKLPVMKKTPKGEPSTAVDVLETLALDYPLPQVILDYRSLSKLKSTYTDALPQQVNPATGRIHTSYHQSVTATGRLSSSDPNLQNIPIRTEAGRQIRQAFIAPAHYRLLSADYSQIELRIMAHLSQDEKLCTAFIQGEDIHQATAAEVFSDSTVTTEQRRRAKAVNFGLIYGMQAFGLAKQLGIERQEAQDYIDTYFARYAAVKRYMETTRELARQQGYVETVFGRRLYIPDIQASNSQRRQYAERSAINAPLQGTAADLIKLAMIKVDHWIRHSGLDIKMILQVHDELVFEVHETMIAQAEQAIDTLMREVASLTVPLSVNITVGPHWGKD